jgi:transcriptional regulator
MYKLPHFTETDSKEIMEFIKSHPLITLIGNDGLSSAATQVPVLISGELNELKLRGHIMRQTDHYKAFLKNPEVLALFTGPQCYISSSWYSERGTGGTWNYITVHVRGTIRLFDDEETIQILTDLTRHFEQGQERPELVENMTHEYVHTNVKAITGFEITVHSLHPIFKLSQNRDDESYISIVKHLEAQSHAGAEAIADEMIKRREKLFSE